MNNFIYPQNPFSLIIIIIVLLVLVVWTIIRGWWIEQKLSLIKKYVSLLNILKNLSTVGSKSNKIVLETLKHPTIGEALLWKKHFEINIKEIEKKFNKFNTKLNELNDNPYRLLKTDCTLIKEQFIELASDTKKFYEDFSELVTAEKIHPINNKFKIIKYEYEDFIKELNKSENSEIKKDMPEYLLSSLSLSTEEWISPYGV